MPYLGHGHCEGGSGASSVGLHVGTPRPDHLSQLSVPEHKHPVVLFAIAIKTKKRTHTLAGARGQIRDQDLEKEK